MRNVLLPHLPTNAQNTKQQEKHNTESAFAWTSSDPPHPPLPTNAQSRKRNRTCKPPIPPLPTPAVRSNTNGSPSWHVRKEARHSAARKFWESTAQKPMRNAKHIGKHSKKRCEMNSSEIFCPEIGNVFFEKTQRNKNANSFPKQQRAKTRVSAHASPEIAPPVRRQTHVPPTTTATATLSSEQDFTSTARSCCPWPPSLPCTSCQLLEVWGSGFRI